MSNRATKQAVIVIDLASMAGTLKYVPGVVLPRSDIPLLERTVANAFLSHLSQHDGSCVADLRSNDDDPPDVTFTYNGLLRGLELSEVVPEHSLEKNAIIGQLRRNILARITVGERTAGFVVSIHFFNDYTSKFRPGRIEANLAAGIDAFFELGDRTATEIQVPYCLREAVARISVYRADLAGDPRLADDREPLIVFGAQNTLLVVEDDCPAIVARALSEKQFHDPGIPTWLLLWSNHYSLMSLRDGLDNAVGRYLQSHPMKYERVFHLHLFAGSGATEFPCTASIGN